MIDYLHEESNVAPRIGAISMGGLTGLILGLRGGTFKRIFFASNGALLMSIICYPKLAGEGYEAANHYMKVGYNFIYGGKNIYLIIHIFKPIESKFQRMINLVLNKSL